MSDKINYQRINNGPRLKIKLQIEKKKNFHVEKKQYQQIMGA